MPKPIAGKKVAILATEGFEQIELTEPRKALREAGAEAVLISPMKGRVRGWNHTQWGEEFTVDLPVNAANSSDYDALFLPGGVMNPDKLRTNPRAVEFVKSFFDSGKIVAAICHGAWTIVEADCVRGRKLTSWPSLQTDIRNAGGIWVDEEVVTDNGLVTSRKPEDIPAFNKKLIEEIAAARQAHQKARTA